MKRFYATILIGTIVILAGCNQGTSGGPGATDPPSKTPITGQTEDTFSLTLPSVKLAQNESKTVIAGINRGTNFSEDVSLKLTGLPTGVVVNPATLLIKRGDTDTSLTLRAAGDAALGDFTVKVSGHPTSGADAVAEMSISIVKQDIEDMATESEDAAETKWEEYSIVAQEQLEKFKVKFAELKERAANAEGQVKADLDLKIADAKIKMDEASVKFEELKSASADRWEKAKEGLSKAFDDLKTIFE